MENSIWRLASWVKNSLAPSTWDYYNGVWNQWVDFERYVSGPLEDGVKLDLLLWFLANLGEDCSFSKVSKVLAALSFLFKLRGWVDVTKCFIVRQVIKGLRRRRVQGDRRKPVTFGLLRGLFGQLGVNFLRVRRSSRKSLLVHEDDSVLSKFQFVAVFRKCLVGLGLQGKEYASHSFRIGH
ncbi:hypothetical protein XELAEV_18013877mg [Xenopus laevis]|uniref:Core-binding (CB) domain-containing protein n=1 Tax=Xenopus laevis TaxID=8355 RepID=A0A974DQP6_XENLA|nr:hypothetical protein XELAEV_18013877mg [Xenopus laevis]